MACANARPIGPPVDALNCVRAAWAAPRSVCVTALASFPLWAPTPFWIPPAQSLPSVVPASSVMIPAAAASAPSATARTAELTAPELPVMPAVSSNTAS